MTGEDQPGPDDDDVPSPSGSVASQEAGDELAGLLVEACRSLRRALSLALEQTGELAELRGQKPDAERKGPDAVVAPQLGIVPQLDIVPASNEAPPTALLVPPGPKAPKRLSCILAAIGEDADLSKSEGSMSENDDVPTQLQGWGSKAESWQDHDHQQHLSVPGYAMDSRRSSAASMVSSALFSGRGSVIQQYPSQIGGVDSSMASVSKDGHFQLSPVWLKRAGSKGDTGSRGPAAFAGNGGDVFIAADTTYFMRLQQDAEDEDWQPSAFRQFFSKLMIHPSSLIRAVWDVMSLQLVLYDMVLIPLLLFELPDTTFSEFMGWVTRFFWTIDIPGTFLTGVLLQNGGCEFDPMLVARRYIKSWLIVDVCIVGIDWSEIFLAAATATSDIGDEENTVFGVARMSKASRTFRIIRMIRLLRLVKMRTRLKQLMERVFSEKMIVFVDIAKIMLIILGVSHVTGCIWYGVGNYPGETTWVTVYQMYDRPIEYRYATALHWSLTQFSGGMDEVTPENFNERVFVIAVFVVFYVMAVAFVSMLTSSMTRLNMISSKQTEQVSVLRRYLCNNGITSVLALRVQHNAQHALIERQRFMPEDQVDLLRLISDPLRSEVHFEMYSEVLAIHPFFVRYIAECPQVMKQVCHLAMSMLLASSGDVIFTAGEVPAQPKMLIVCAGCLQYTSTHGQVSTVEERQWISEANLWTNWMHQGVLTATSDCRLCLVDAKIFQEIAGQFEHPTFDPRYYAAEFVRSLNHATTSELTDLSELPSQEEGIRYSESSDDSGFEPLPQAEFTRAQLKVVDLMNLALKVDNRSRKGRRAVKEACSKKGKESVRQSVLDMVNIRPRGSLLTARKQSVLFSGTGMLQPGGPAPPRRQSTLFGSPPTTSGPNSRRTSLAQAFSSSRRQSTVSTMPGKVPATGPAPAALGARRPSVQGGMGALNIPGRFGSGPSEAKKERAFSALEE